jgi:photosystem II stability/assembly factor-like uncharacterized protein
MKKIYMGFNTTGNSQTSGRTTNAVFLGKLRNTQGSTTRKFKYCNTNSPDLAQTFRCVFDIPPEDTNGKYQIAVGLNAFSISRDFGITWEQKPEFASYSLRSVAISNDGKYILAGGQNTPLFYSNNGGLSYTQKILSEDWYEIKMSKSGQYQTAIGPINKIYKSNDYGQTFTIKNTFGDPPLNTSSSYLAMSYDGKYQTITFNTGVYKSNDYGQTWNKIDLSLITNPPNALFGVSMSANGQIQMAVNAIGSQGYVYKSIDYGETWEYINEIPNAQSLFFISLSASGQYVLITDYEKYLWISNDYGSNFTTSINIDGQPQPISGGGWYPCGVSSTGQYQTVCDYGFSSGSGGYIYTSSDYGMNFYSRPSGGFYQWWGFFMS